MGIPTPPHSAPPAQTMEAMMRDEIFDRDYQAGRNALHDGIDRLVEGIAKTLRVLHAIQFESPWSRNSNRRAAGS